MEQLPLFADVKVNTTDPRIGKFSPFGSWHREVLPRKAYLQDLDFYDYTFTEHGELYPLILWEEKVVPNAMCDDAPTTSVFPDWKPPLPKGIELGILGAEERALRRRLVCQADYSWRVQLAERVVNRWHQLQAMEGFIHDPASQFRFVVYSVPSQQAFLPLDGCGLLQMARSISQLFNLRADPRDWPVELHYLLINPFVNPSYMRADAPPVAYWIPSQHFASMILSMRKQALSKKPHPEVYLRSEDFDAVTDDLANQMRAGVPEEKLDCYAALVKRMLQLHGKGEVW